MKQIETVKSIALVILFTLSVTLASIYIVNTQRLTMAGESALDLDSLLFLRGEGSEVTELDVSYILPETVCYSVNGDMRAVFADSLSMAQLYAAAKDILIDVLSNVDSAKIAADRDEVITECTSSQNFVYFKYHAPLPSQLILTSISGSTLSSQTVPIGEDIPNISEIFLLLENISTNTTTYSAVMICGDETVLTIDRSTIAADDAERSFAPDTLTAFNTTPSAVKCAFAANTDTSGFGEMEFSDTALITENVISAPLLAVNEPITGGKQLSESMLRCFEFNPDRINTYNESDSVSVYVEENMTLRVEEQLIRYTAPSDDGIEAARLLGYESYSGNYSVIELIGAAGSFIESVRFASGGLIGGETQPTLTSIESDGTKVTLRFTLTYGGAAIYGDAFEPIVGYAITFAGGRLTSADICTLSFTSGIGSVASYTQRWTLDKLAPKLSPMVRASAGRIESGYVISDLGGNSGALDVKTAAFEWVYVYGNKPKEAGN